MREIILDTETTGLEPADGDRLVEIGCVELVNKVPTGRTFHQYLNPERDVPAEAVAVHGLTREFLKDKPVFSQILTDFLEFIGDAVLVIHNAEFDMKFINAELSSVGHGGIPMKRVTDTLTMARKKFPGSPASLDALCRRYNIDLTGRELHGALLDSQLLAEVYMELSGGRQAGLSFEVVQTTVSVTTSAPLISLQAARERKAREPRPHAPTQEELA
ncbi:MAG TPA: DNA polymerase III subunit epsilon, partial [Alphaproteobacteria bacterium]